MTMRHQLETMAKTMSTDVTHAGQQVWYAGLGAVDMAGNASRALFDMLVEEGRKTYTRGSKQVVRLVDDANDSLMSMTKALEHNVQSTTKVALHRLGVPSRKDVADLTRRVELLTTKVEQLGTRRPRARRK